MPTTVDYLGMRFLDADLTGIRAALTRALDGLFGYVVTPNVDHVVSYHDGGAALRAAYDGALFQICDSRVLAGMAAFSGVRLRPCPGSDLTDDILRRPLRPGLRVGVIGPDAQAFERLRGLFPGPSFVFLPSSARLVVGSAEWNETVAAAAAAEWDILLICLSFPKQEFFAQALARSGRARGLAFCVGASVDFLTGKQKRAPALMQKTGLEWLHRLASDPRRLAGRYLLRGPKVFLLSRRLRQKAGARRGAGERRVLFLTTVLPHRRQTGGEIASMNFVEGLTAAGCEVDVVAYRREGERTEPPPGFHAPCELPIESAGRPVRSGVWMGRALLTGRPFSVQKYVTGAMRRLVRERLRSGPYDLAVVDHAQASWLLPLLPKDLPTVLVAHNVEHRLYAGHGDAVRAEAASGEAGPGGSGGFARRLKAAVYKREGERLLRVERAALARCREVWALSEDDAATLGELAGGSRVRAFALPGQSFDGGGALPEARVDVGLLGSWSWDVNRAGLDWFVRDVAPRLPADLDIVVAGRSLHAPGSRVGNVRYVGFVPDAGAFLRSCRVVVIPSTVGSGIQIKTVETLGLGVPTVATTIALRGIDDPPLDLRVANSATDMTRAIEEALAAPRPSGLDGEAWRAEREAAFRRTVAAALDGLCGAAEREAFDTEPQFGVALS